MITFWFYAGLLFVAALAFILVPQLLAPRRRIDVNRTSMNVGLYRERLRELEVQHDAGSLDAAQMETARIEAARELLDDAQDAKRGVGAPLGRAIPLLAALCVPLLALGLYLHWGSLNLLVQARQDVSHTAQSIGKITEHLETLLSTRPDSSEGWTLLGRAYMTQGRMADAAGAFERAATLAGRPSQLLGLWAEALYFAGNRQWTQQLQLMIDEALAGNPQETTSLKLAGLAAFQERRYAEAVVYWERLLATSSGDDSRRAAIANDIARARKLAN